MGASDGLLDYLFGDAAVEVFSELAHQASGLACEPIQMKACQESCCTNGLDSHELSNFPGSLFVSDEICSLPLLRLNQSFRLTGVKLICQPFDPDLVRGVTTSIKARPVELLELVPKPRLSIHFLVNGARNVN